MIRVFVFLAVGVILATPTLGQQPASDNPNVLRPPAVLSFPFTTRQQEVIRLYFAELDRAIQAGDTTTLSVLVPDRLVPVEERLNARRGGCPSLGAAMNRAKRSGAMVNGPNARRLEQVQVLPAAQGDTIAFGTAQLTINGRTSELSVALTSSSHARRMARVQGLLPALCAAPPSQTDRVTVQQTPSR